MTMETTYTDDDVLRAHNADTPPPLAPTGYSKSVMTAFRRAKKACVANDKRSRRIVESLNKERAGNCNNVVTLPIAKYSQSNLMDF